MNISIELLTATSLTYKERDSMAWLMPRQNINSLELVKPKQ